MLTWLSNIAKTYMNYIIIGLCSISVLVYIKYLWSEIDALKNEIKVTNAVLVQTKIDAKLASDIKNNLIKQLQKEVKYDNVTTIEQLNQQIACTKILLEGTNKNEIKVCNSIMYVK